MFCRLTATVNRQHPIHTADMPYRIPSDDDVAKAIEDCMSAHPRIRSQYELHLLVSTELMCIDPRFRIGPARIRRIGVDRGIFDMEIRYAHTPKVRERSKCPVCRNPLVPVRNRTIEGETVELRRVCRACGYSATGDADRPCGYIITRR